MAIFNWKPKLVLPTVYDDALSYQEILGKVIDALNQMGETGKLVNAVFPNEDPVINVRDNGINIVGKAKIVYMDGTEKDCDIDMTIPLAKGDNVNLAVVDGVVKIFATDTTYTGGNGIVFEGTVVKVNYDEVQRKLTAGEGIVIQGATIAIDPSVIGDEIVAGNGITVTGNTISVDYSKVQAKLTAGNGITISEQTIAIDPSRVEVIENKTNTLTADSTATQYPSAKAVYDKVTAVEEVANTANSNATAAQTTANAAQETANTANSNATAAQTTANAAQETANTANSRATTAQATANDANELATNARSTANTAKTAAEQAETKADAAKTQAASALETADAAQAAATLAQNRADSAYNLANTASPTVETETIAGGTKVTITDKDGAHEFNIMNGVDGKSAYQIATEHGYTGTESEWLASLHAANPKVLPMSQYPTETEAIAYMDSQTDHSIIYVWNNKVYCYVSKTATQLTGACLYGYRNSASSGIVAADGKSMYVIPVSSFATPLTISDYTFPISSTPYIYGGTVIPTFNVALIQQDSWVGKTDAFNISAEQLQGCTYVVFAVTTSSQPPEVSVTVNGTVVPLSVITSPSQISEVVGTGTTTVDGYVDSGVIYTAIISSSSTEKYVNDRNSYILPVPSGYCESHATYEAGTHYLTKYPYETMTGMFSALATANSAYITETTLGKDQSNTYDIKSYILDAPSSLASGQASSVSSEKPVFIITAGLHGLEPDAVHTVYHFMQDLAENYYESEQLQYLHDNIRFVIIPICNPWGYVNQNYNNSRDVDLNKNFECGYRTNGTENTGTEANSEAETLLMKQVFDEYPKAIFHLECHGKYGVDTTFNKTIWFSLMQTLHSELIELNANKLNSQIGKRLYNLGYSTNKSTGGYITYFGLNGRPKDYTGTKYGILSGTMEGTGCIYSDSGYSVNTQKINCEALENFVLDVIDSLGSKVKVRNTDN